MDIKHEFRKIQTMDEKFDSGKKEYSPCCKTSEKIFNQELIYSPISSTASIIVTEKKIILIIEDEKDIREALKEGLELEDYKVYTAANGKEALDLLENIPLPGLILLDLMMPIMDGWEFRRLQQLNSKYAPIPVIVLSAVADKIRSLNAATYVKKPVELERLLRIIKSLCN